jgi:hypothetical protein
MIPATPPFESSYTSSAVHRSLPEKPIELAPLLLPTLSNLAILAADEQWQSGAIN